MIPVIFINGTRFPFISLILSGSKLYETRTRNTLLRFVGERVLLAETGHGKPLVMAYATIDHAIEVYTREAWEKYRKEACIAPGSAYDWNDGTTKKVLYRLTDVTPVQPFRLPDTCRRHGRVWAELPDLLVTFFGNTGGNVYCCSALYRGKYFIFGSDYMDAFTIDPMYTTDENGDLIDPNEYQIAEADDFPTWGEILDAIRSQMPKAASIAEAEITYWHNDLSVSSHLL